MRKILLFITILILISVGGLFLYNKFMVKDSTVAPTTLKSLFFNDSTSNTATPSGGFSLGNIFNDNSFNVQTSTVPKSQFKRLTTYPVAGLVAYDRVETKIIPADPKIVGSKPKTETTTKKVIRYVSRRNGYVYEIEGSTTPLQITNISIPNIYEAVFTNSNNNVLLRFLRDDKTIATYNVSIPKENIDGTRTQLNGSFLPDNITSIAVSPNTSRIAYLIPNINGSTVSISDFANLKKTTLLENTFREWSLSWPQEKKVFLQTKPSHSVKGFLYSFDTPEKRLRRTLSDIFGLTSSVSPSGGYILYSESLQDSFVGRIYNTKDNSDISLGLAILPEKCVWMKNDNLVCAGGELVGGKYPDDWYQGLVSLSDKVYLIDVSGGIRTLFDGSEQSFDMINLSLDESSRLLYFINKPTGELWRFNY